MYNPYLQNLPIQMPSMPIQTEIQKVTGIESARTFPMGPNSSIILMDLSNPIIYVVVSDASGFKTVTPFDITEHVEQKPADQLQMLTDRIVKIEERMNAYESNHGAVESD